MAAPVTMPAPGSASLLTGEDPSITQRGAVMPRKSQAEMIAELERKLEEARNKATEKVKTDIEKLHEKRATLVEREQKIAAQILSVDEQIAALVAGEASTTQLTFTATEAEEV